MGDAIREFLLSWYLVVSWLFVFFGTAIYFIHRNRLHGSVLLVVLVVLFTAAIYASLQVRNPRAMGWDFGATTVVAFMLTVIVLLLITLVFNILAIKMTSPAISQWIADKGKFPVFDFLPLLSLAMALFLFIISITKSTNKDMIIAAIVTNDTKALNKLMIAPRVSNMNVDYSKESFLHFAAYRGNSDAVKILLEKGADPNKKSESGVTPLQKILEDKYDIAEITEAHTMCAVLLIKARTVLKQDVVNDLFNKLDRKQIASAIFNQVIANFAADGKTVRSSLSDSDIEELYCFYLSAMKLDRTEETIVFTEKNNLFWLSFEGGLDLLDVAFMEGNNPFAQYLLNREEKTSGDKNPNTKAQTQSDNAFLPIYAIGKVDVSTAELYFKKFGFHNINSLRYYDTPLCNAIENANSGNVRLLLDNGADPNLFESPGEPPLCKAAETANVKILRMLINRGANVHAKCNCGSLIYVVCDRKEESLDCVKQLYELGVSIDSSGDKGTPLHLAAEKGFANISSFLISKMQNIDIANYEGKTPLLEACANENEEIVKMLIDRGAEPNKPDNYGDSPLSVTCTRFGCTVNKPKVIRIIRMLMEHGVDKEKNKQILQECLKGELDLSRTDR